MHIVTKERYSHLVSIVKGESFFIPWFIFQLTFMVPVPEAEDGDNSPWFVFNDFVVRNISEDEALSFPDKWKVRNHIPLLSDQILILISGWVAPCYRVSRTSGHEGKP